MKLLIIEDERSAGEYLRRGFAESGFQVELARSGVDGMHLALSGDHDLIVLDVMLPGPSGWEIMASIRSAGRDVPVLFLTARDQIADRVKGLDLGADDYLIKPFAFPELLARVRTLLRRGRLDHEPTMLRVSDLEVDLLRRQVRREGQSIRLTAKEFGLLELLLRRRGEVLSRSQIASLVWDINFDSDTNVIDVAIRRLRRKIDDPYDQKLIRTVRGMGYSIDTVDL